MGIRLISKINSLGFMKSYPSFYDSENEGSSSGNYRFEFSDDFEGLPLNQTYNESLNGVSIIVDPDDLNNHVCDFTGDTQRLGAYIMPVCISDFELTVKFKQVAYSAGGGAIDLMSRGGTVAAEVYSRAENGGFVAYYDSSYNLIQSVTIGTWYEVKIHNIDFTNKTFQVTIDNILKGTYPFYNNSTVSDIGCVRIYQNGGGNDFQIDDLSIKSDIIT